MPDDALRSRDRRTATMVRGDGERPVTNMELFFDLVYVFAITQLSHLLVSHASVDGAIQAAVLVAMVWQLWAYTTWMTNFLDPERPEVRLALVVLMLSALVLAAELPYAFQTRGWLIAGLFVATQLGRGLFIVWALRGEALQQTFWRICAWGLLAAVAMFGGAAVHGHGRELLWALAVVIELVGAAIGYRTPGLGRSKTSDWTVDGHHFAERCQAFVLIAFGESIVVIGARLYELDDPDGAQLSAFLLTFVGSVALWWVYFDRAAADSSAVISTSEDPGRLARNGFHWIHPLIVGGIIVTAAADDVVLGKPTERGSMSTAWLILGGTALYLGGHAIFKAVLWRVVPWSRLLAVFVLLALLVLAPHLTAITLTGAATVIVIAVAVTDHLRQVSDAHAGRVATAGDPALD